jgi:HNH endonuclease/Methylase-associated X1
VDLVGVENCRVVDALEGWPSRVDVRTFSGWQEASIHVGEIGLSHRGRDNVERRFQNPGKGKPVISLAGTVPLLVGLSTDYETPVVVGMDAIHRVGAETRQSLFIPLWLLEAAANRGWAEHENASGELIRAFQPQLLGTYVELIRSGDQFPAPYVAEIADAAGLVEKTVSETPEERVRRIVSALSRDRRFAKTVLEAYEERCAMCGLDLGMVIGAHIYPVNAPGSSDKVWNGLALCCNHHAAFDAHLIHVEPGSLALRLHPRIIADGKLNDQSRRFAASLFPELRVPKERIQMPRPAMFEKRYQFFEKRYEWAS